MLYKAVSVPVEMTPLLFTVNPKLVYVPSPWNSIRARFRRFPPVVGFASERNAYVPRKVAFEQSPARALDARHMMRDVASEKVIRFMDALLSSCGSLPDISDLTAAPGLPAASTALGG